MFQKQICCGFQSTRKLFETGSFSFLEVRKAKSTFCCFHFEIDLRLCISYLGFYSCLKLDDWSRVIWVNGRCFKNKLAVRSKAQENSFILTTSILVRSEKLKIPYGVVYVEIDLRLCISVLSFFTVVWR